LPPSKDESLAIALRHNATIQAAESDKAAAKYAFHSTSGAFLPTVAVEGRASRGLNSGGVFGERTDLSGMVVATWDIFRGGQDLWKRNEMAERYVEQTMRHARLQRDAYESIDKAWAARTITNDRIAALSRQIQADRRVIGAYGKEYDLGQRSLIDLLNAQNQLFNALVSIESARGVAIFADYQLLAAIGSLLEYLKMQHHVDAEPLVSKPFGLIPITLPPIRISLPDVGSEPLNVGASWRDTERALGSTSYAFAPAYTAAGDAFGNRWPSGRRGTVTSWFEHLLFPRRPESAPTDFEATAASRSAFAPEASGIPAWLASVNKVN
jgi:adhesin transport system outer membrane protein